VDAAITCTVSSTQTCPITSLAKNTTTLVYPGSGSACLKHETGPYAFQVIPRDLTKLHFHFQEGGACWDRLTTWEPACQTKLVPESDTAGLFSATNTANPYRDFTVIVVLYCSGDLHVGNVTRDYDDSRDSGVLAQQFGAINTRAVLNWIKAQNLGTLQELLVSGSSAGAIAVQTWNPVLLSEIMYKHAAVIVDSYVGVIPCQGHLIVGFGACNTDIFNYYPNYLKRKCDQKWLEMWDFVPSTFVSHPNVAFLYLQSKYDAVQIEFEAGVAATCIEDPLLIDQESFYAWSNEIFEQYSVYKNFQVFLVDSSHHTYIINNAVYTATTKSQVGTGGGPKMIDVINALPGLPQNTIVSQCNGAASNRNQFSGTAYCDSGYLPRSWP